MKQYELNKTQKTSRILLGLIFCLSVFGLPIGIWLFIVSKRRIILNKDSIQIKPLGKDINIHGIKRIGVGSLKQLMPGNSTLNPSASPSYASNLVMLIESKSGKQIRIPLSNYETGLSQAILSHCKQKAFPLKNSKILPWKVSF